MRGLLGKHLSHSYSKVIHERIDQQEYNLIECDDLDSFFQEKSFKALNVTIPYKFDVIKYLDETTSSAKEIGAVNTIINNSGRLKGYNTDIDGLEFLLEYNSISVKGKTIGILGNGATSRTIQYVAKKFNAKNIYVFARNPKENEYFFDNDVKLAEVEVLFNATPNGMYPNNDDSLLVDMALLSNCSAVIDLIYNPLRSSLLLCAENHNKKAVNGLMMLVHQAVKANEYFNNVIHEKSITIDIYKDVLLNIMNIVLIGMPMSGKSYYSRAVSEKYNKELYDIDKYIEENNNMSIPKIFETKGESMFRQIEKDSIYKISKGLNLAISTGGGVVLDKENIDFLKQNGILIFLDMPLNELKQCNPKGRPLLKDPKNIEKLYNDRYHLYNKYCDKRVEKRGFKRLDTLSKIEVKLNEYINS